ncbi:MAG: hypothetical protein O3B01_20490 [Planctomycetota bacterium]|nr:hypothetical protein [Planctomycetota bacterium]MDA1140951.1 hypothetical protein [Planctomycetota bacterium]
MAKKIFITFEEAIDEMGITGDQLQAWIRGGKIRAFRFHNTMSFKRDEIEALKGDCPNADGDPVAPSGRPEGGRAPSTPNLGIADVVGDILEQQLRVPSLKDLKIPSLKDAEEDELTVSLSELLFKAPAGDDDEETFLEPLGTRNPMIESPPATVAPSDSDLIRFHCECGKRLKSNKEYIGKPVLCPRCLRKLKVPPVSESRREKTASPVHPAMVQIMAKLKKLKGEVREISAKFDALEKAPEGVAHGGLINRMGSLEKQTQKMAKELEALRKENQQFRFDIARLQDLMTRLLPEAAPTLTGHAPLSDSSDEDTWHDE